MKKLYRSIVRRSGRWTDILPVAVILSLALIFGGSILSGLLFGAAGLKRIFSLAGDADIAQFMLDYADFLGIWLMFILVSLVFRNDRPMLSELSLRGGRSVRGMLAGLLLGFVTNGACILISWLLGDIKLTYNGFRPGVFFAFLLVVCIQSGAEEVADRCYLYQKLRRRYRHPAVAIIVNSLAFAAMHLLNPGISAVSVAEIAVTGIIFSLFVYYYDSLWAAIMMHTGWNFTQSIAFGLPNSGIVSKYSLFRLDAASARNGLFYNVNFGVEGSLGSLAILIVMMIVLIVLGRGKKEKRDLWAGLEAEKEAAAAAKRAAQA